MGFPSTQITSDCGSAFVPCSVTTWPFRVTRPAAMISSALRREAMPAAARIFWRRRGMGEVSYQLSVFSKARTSAQCGIACAEFLTEYLELTTWDSRRISAIRDQEAKRRKRKDNAETQSSQRRKKQELGKETFSSWIVRAHPYKPRVGHPQVH